MVRSKGPVFREMRASIFLKGRRVLSYAIKVSWSRNMFRNISHRYCKQSGAWHLEMTPNYEWIPANPASRTIAYNVARHHCFLQSHTLNSTSSAQQLFSTSQWQHILKPVHECMAVPHMLSSLASWHGFGLFSCRFTRSSVWLQTPWVDRPWVIVRSISV